VEELRATRKKIKKYQKHRNPEKTEHSNRGGGSLKNQWGRDKKPHIKKGGRENSDRGVLQGAVGKQRMTRGKMTKKKSSAQEKKGPKEGKEDRKRTKQGKDGKSSQKRRLAAMIPESQATYDRTLTSHSEVDGG